MSEHMNLVSHFNPTALSEPAAAPAVPQALRVGDVMWEPTQAQIENANITKFARAAIKRWKLRVNTWPDFHRWSVESPEQFWQSVWEEMGVIGTKAVDLKGKEMPITPKKPWRVLVTENSGDGPVHPMLDAKWFPDARLNFAQNMLAKKSEAHEAIVFWGEDKVKRRVSWNDLLNQVSRVAQGLKAAGIRPGDRVAALMPNMPETVVAMLATASLGGVWTSCSPDFGLQGVIDRFGQVEPKVLFAPDGYFLNGKAHDIVDKVTDIVRRLPSVREVVVVPYIANNPNVDGVPRAATYPEFVAPFKPAPLEFAQLPFAHPLFILYSSGTTGMPKCIVHSAGGTLLNMLKEHQLQSDVNPGDRVFYYTTCGWMMWNWLACALGSGATVMLYDGSPFAKRGNILWDFAQNEKCTHFGVSAKYLESAEKLGQTPMRTHNLDRVRAILSTGSPLSPESFDYIYRSVKANVALQSVSGGTDICGCFVMGNPVLPVRKGEIQHAALGLRMEIWLDAKKRAAVGEKGELVCTQAFPNMPVGFWGDEGNVKYRAAYFEHFANVWHHGDYASLTPSHGLMIFGRSDAVLNPGGVRIGTAEIYRQVERIPEVAEAVAVGQNWLINGKPDQRIVLFVKMREGVSLDESLVQKIKSRIREHTTPHHVPEKILQVGDVPRTRSGKIAELAVRAIIHGEPVKNAVALANAECLDDYRNRAELTA
jgi:acetoacetyl-CoA synthetase